MTKIGLDLAVRNCGLAIKDEQGKLIYCSYSSKEKDYLKLQIEITDWIFVQINWVIQLPHQLIIEDLFVGLDPTSSLDAAKTHGAVIDRYFKITRKFPKIISAISARNLVKINPRASKAEIQLAITERLQLDGLITDEVKGEVKRLRNHYELVKKRIAESRKTASTPVKEKLKREQAEAKRVMDNGLNRMSTQIRTQTGIDEHQADALVLIMGEDDAES